MREIKNGGEVMKTKYNPGSKMINHQGFEVTIIERVPGKKTNNILVEFNDEERTRIWSNTESFRLGTTKNPKYKRGIDNRIVENQTERVGAENVNYLNEPIKVIAYRSSLDIDVEFQDEFRGVVTTTWRQFKDGHIRNPNQDKTGIIKHPSNFTDLNGQIFNDLLVIGWDTNPPETENIKDESTGLWKCRCLRCGELAWANTSELKGGQRKACRKCGYKAKTARKYDIKYDLSGEFGIGYTYNTGVPFYFDLEDYDLIKDCSWKEDENGFIITTINDKTVSMHRLVMRTSDSKQVVDHIRHERFDNRKQFLRITTVRNNTRNEKLAKNNKSGKTGVCWEASSNKWRAYIWVDKTIHLGSFDNIEDAIDARLKAEEKYFGDYSYDNSMKIGDNNERRNF